ncbi:MAG: discoidin domain-containing protein [Chloroflexota bacterium]
MRSPFKTIVFMTALLLAIAVIMVSVVSGFVLYRDVPLPTPTLPSPIQQIEQSTSSSRIIEIAAGKPTTASSYYIGGPDYSFPPSAIVDGYIIELDCGIGVERGNIYWLLADGATGWVQINLQQTYLIVKLRWLNTHNGNCGDRATTQFHIALSSTGDFSGEEEDVYQGMMGFSYFPQFQEAMLTTPAAAQYVRFYVDGYDKWGGGLNELEVYADVSNP